MAIRNLMEEIVVSCMKELRSNRPELLAASEDAIEDMMAIALNRLPPRYVTTRRGEAIAKSQVRSQLESDVFRELAAAAETVLKSPRGRA